uniref:Nuclease associated modular domain-containing protein n=1 Tax=Opuntia streptacantha TaxID=393608 RepID=A0A7C9ABL1_OPUST
MPLLDIAIAQSSFQNHWDHTRLQLCVNGKATNYSLLQYEERWASFSKFSQKPGKMNSHLSHCMKLHPKFLVKAVATFDPKISVQSEDGGKGRNGSLCIHESVSSTVHAESSDADSEEIDEKEKSRRVKISKANKGKMPWNKGRKHSPETLQRIRERTKLALQDPEVKAS